MSLSFLDLRQMDSEMETAGIAGGPRNRNLCSKPVFPRNRMVCCPALPYPGMATWAEQAPSRCLPLPLSDSEGSAFLSETSFQRGSRSFTH